MWSPHLHRRFPARSLRLAIRRRNSLCLERLEQRLPLTAAIPADDAYTLPDGGRLEVPAEFSVLRNDGGVEKADSVELANSPSLGMVEFQPDGSFVYTASDAFVGRDSFSYRLVGSEPTAATATVTIGTADALDDIVRYRFEVLGVDGQSVSTAPVGSLLELRGYAEHLGDDPDVGVVFATLSVDQEGTFSEFERPIFGDSFRALSIGGPPDGPLNVGALRFDREISDGEEVLFRAFFIANALGTVSFRATGPLDVHGTPSSPWPVYARREGGRLGEFDAIPVGAIDYGEAVQVEFVAAASIPPVTEDDIYEVAARGTLEVDAAAGVLANDDSPNAAPLTAHLVQGPTRGELTFREDGSFTYVQAYHGSGAVDRFYYLAHDGQLARLATAMIRISDGSGLPTKPQPSVWRNASNPFDINADGNVSAEDRNLVASALASRGAGVLPEPTDGDAPPPFLDVNGDRSLSSADLDLMDDQLGEDLVGIRLALSDTSGATVSSVGVGERFVLQVFASDLRAAPEGVFASFNDVTFDAALVTPSGEIEYGPAFQLGLSGELGSHGQLDEVGGARSVATASTPGVEQLVYQMAFTSSAAGQLTFSSDPADWLPQHDVLLLGRDTPVPLSRVDYGDVTLTIGGVPLGAPESKPDHYDAVEDEQVVIPAARGVLANDTDPNGQPITAELVALPVHGSVLLGIDGAIQYTPNPNFAGEDRFSYRATNGTSSSAPTVVSIRVAPVDDDPPVAEGDRFFVMVDSVLAVSAADGVLTNDHDPDEDTLTAQLVDSPAHGQIQLAEDGSFTYSPELGYTGEDSFTYQVSDGSAASEIVRVDLHVQDAPGAIVRIRLDVVDQTGESIQEVTVGDSFRLQAFVEDLRGDPHGVFSAYADVEYDPDLAAVSGIIGFSETYGNGTNGDTSTPGIIDEVGGFTSSVEPLGGGEFLLFEADFLATAAGEFQFAGNPADELPIHDIAVYGLNEAVPGGQVDFADTTIMSVPSNSIAFRRAALKILAREVNPVQQDTFAIQSDSAGQTLSVLENDLDGDLTVQQVTAGSAGGTADPSSDRKSIRYTPPADFIGEDTLTYTARDAHGNDHSAGVTVNVVSRYQNQSNRYDADGDGVLAPLDALFGINRINERGARKLQIDDLIIEGRTRFLDTNGDGFHSSGDILSVINQLNAQTAAADGEPTLLPDTVAIQQRITNSARPGKPARDHDFNAAPWQDRHAGDVIHTPPSGVATAPVPRSTVPAASDELDPLPVDSESFVDESSADWTSLID